MFIILSDKEFHRLMATLQEVLDSVNKLSADVDAFISSHQTNEAADLDQIQAAIAAVDAKLTPSS